MWSAIAWTSLSLWEMKTIDWPPERSSRMTRNRSSVSPGVSTAVGSSRISTLAWRSSALMISTRCCTPTGRSSIRASGFDLQPVALGKLPTWRRAFRRSSRPGPRVGSTPSMTFSATVNTGTSMKCWWTMPIRALIASLGDRIVTGLAVDADLALIGLHQPVEDVHQRGLAGPVLAEQAADLTRERPEVDVVVGHEAAEALRDAAQLKFHARPSAGAPAGGHGQRAAVPSRRLRACRQCDPGWAGPPTRPGPA